MTKEELREIISEEMKKQLATEITPAVQAAIKAELSSFYVEREQHYLDHQFICGVREFNDRIKNEACKKITGGILLGFGLLLLAGAWLVLKHWLSKPFVPPTVIP